VEASNHPRPFDVRTVRYLVRLMRRYDLGEIDLEEGDKRIRLRRSSRAGSDHYPPAHAPAAATAAAPVTAPALAEKPAEKSGRNLLEIKSPAVGTFYAQKEPGAPPYVTVGSRVGPDTVVCIIEAMKVLNEIPAGCSGVIAEVSVSNKDFVEYGTVLFRVDPAG
jgi:acetyl-CoA carboxylase biotin carboxyl carrier protein